MQAIELIRLRLLSCSYTFDELESWMRRKRPRVMRDAIGVLLLRLKHQGRVRIINGRWETCRPIMLSIAPKLPSNVLPFRRRKPFWYSSHPPFEVEEIEEETA